MIMKIDLESGDHHSTVDRGVAMLAGLDDEGDVPAGPLAVPGRGPGPGGGRGS
ncbi:hypothetical protein ACIBHX_02385 [Nonomuraea sp. NPDC050536]|uniref:hypothetical protein n=1 Tax=Nonomuraea sp. NPDC050536 TaxID=3364366 RepID=UPI0037C929B4